MNKSKIFLSMNRKHSSWLRLKAGLWKGSSKVFLMVCATKCSWRLFCHHNPTEIHCIYFNKLFLNKEISKISWCLEHRLTWNFSGRFSEITLKLEFRIKEAGSVSQKQKWISVKTVRISYGMSIRSSKFMDTLEVSLDLARGVYLAIAWK